MQNSFVTLETVNIWQTFFQVGKHCVRYPLTVRRNLPVLPAPWLDVGMLRSDGVELDETTSPVKVSTTIAHMMKRSDSEKTDILAGLYSSVLVQFWYSFYLRRCFCFTLLALSPSTMDLNWWGTQWILIQLIYLAVFISFENLSSQAYDVQCFE